MGELRKDALPDPRQYIEAQGLRPTGRGKWVTTACTFHGGSDSLRWNLESGGWVCMSCGEHGGDVLDYHTRAHGLRFIDAAKELGAWDDAASGARRMSRPASPPQPRPTPEPAALAEYWRDVWRECVPLQRTDGARYLKARACAMPPAGSHLRFHPKLKHPSGYQGPALVALVTSAATGKAMTLHRTWIQPDGRKADVDPPRMLAGGQSKQGGVIRLWPEDCVTHGLGVCEGIETALSMAHAYSPVWACIDAGNLGAFPVLRGIEVLFIGADNDPAGKRGAEACAERWTQAGAAVFITRQAANDLNDVVQEVA